MTESHRAGPLFTDLYELTMAASYFANKVFDVATFSLYIRDVYATRITLWLQVLSKCWMNWQPSNFLIRI